MTTMPLRQKLLTGGGAGLFVSLFLPWASAPEHGGTESTPGWNGYASIDGTPLLGDLGVLTGLLATVLMGWEMLRQGGPEPRHVARRWNLCSAVLAGMTALSSVALFAGAVVIGHADRVVASTGIEGNASVGPGAFLTLAAGISVAIGATLALRTHSTR